VKINEMTFVSGYVTKDKFIRGRTIEEIERILGFQRGRFQRGISVARLERLPSLSEFELAAYSMIPEHRYSPPDDLDLRKLKQLALESWSLMGLERLLKVKPNVPHMPDLPPDWQYPPGLGAPQWKITARLPGTIVAVIDEYPGGRYQPLM
jgi:hypothetical protein